MWKDILKSPYKIQTEEYINTYSKLFQGTQREEDTGYWTPSLDEALIYAFFGSEIYSIKDEGKPMIKQALKTNKENDLYKLVKTNINLAYWAVQIIII